MSAAWMSNDRGTTIARHEWKGLSKMRYKLEDWVEKERQEAIEVEIGSRLAGLRGPRRRATQHVPGHFEEDDEEWVNGDE